MRATLTSSQWLTLGTRLAPVKGLARNGQGNVRSPSLVWQRPSWALLPYVWRTGKIWQLILRGPAGAGSWAGRTGYGWENTVRDRKESQGLPPTRKWPPRRGCMDLGCWGSCWPQPRQWVLQGAWPAQALLLGPPRLFSLAHVGLTEYCS